MSGFAMLACYRSNQAVWSLYLDSLAPGAAGVRIGIPEGDHYGCVPLAFEQLQQFEDALPGIRFEPNNRDKYFLEWREK